MLAALSSNHTLTVRCGVTIMVVELAKNSVCTNPVGFVGGGGGGGGDGGSGGQSFGSEFGGHGTQGALLGSLQAGPPQLPPCLGSVLHPWVFHQSWAPSGVQPNLSQGVIPQTGEHK